MPKGLFSLYLCNALTYRHIDNRQFCMSLSLHFDHITSILWLRHLLVESDNPLNHIFNYCLYDFSAISPKTSLNVFNCSLLQLVWHFRHVLSLLLLIMILAYLVWSVKNTVLIHYVTLRILQCPQNHFNHSVPFITFP